MATETSVAIGHRLGDTVWRLWSNKDPGRVWYEPYDVVKVTAKQVWVRGFMEDKCIILKRGVLERIGSCTSYRHGAIFYLKVPDFYERRTIGYLMDREPREVLGLHKDYTDEDLKAAYRRKALEHHPDRGGDPGRYKEVHAAYERLKHGFSVLEILNFAQSHKTETSKDSAIDDK